MERKFVVVCIVVVPLGLLSAALGFVAGAIRIMDFRFVSSGHCASPPSLLSPLLGLMNVLILLISQIILNVPTECIYCIKALDSNGGVALRSFILSWFIFVFAVFNFLDGVLFFGNYNCLIWRVGVFTGGAIIALTNSAFGIVYYQVLILNLERIAMGQPQIPQIIQDPVFVHEDTYNRRQIP